MGKPKHPEYKEFKKWVKSKLVAINGKYDPEKFHMEKVNWVLLQLDIYIKEWENDYNEQ